MTIWTERNCKLRARALFNYPILPEDFEERQLAHQ